MIPYLVAIGLVSILGQVALLRELNVASYGVELIYILGMGGWLLGTAVGAMFGRRAYVPRADRVGLLLLGAGFLLPADVAFIRAARTLFAGVPGAYLPFPLQLLVLTLAVFPVGLVLGLLFQWAAKRFVSGGRTVALAYAIESAGGLLGGLVATLSLRAGLQNFVLVVLCALFATACVLFVGGPRNRRLFLSGVLLAGGWIVLLWQSPAADRRLTALDHPNHVASRDTPYGRVTVTALAGQVSVFENDELSFETEGTAAEEFVHLAALQHPDPKRVLLLGGGIEGVAKEIRQHHPTEIDYVELNGRMLQVVLPLLPEEIRGSLSDGRVHVRIGDPRRFLQSCGSYDLILVRMPEPSSGQTNRFYTREFFAQCSRRLEAGGILAFTLRSAENLWTPQLARRTASIYCALESVFPEVLVLPGTTNTVIASHRPLLRDPEVLATRLRDRGIEARLVTPAYLRYVYTNDRLPEIAGILETSRAPMNSDARPVCYQFATLLWLSKFFPVLAWLDLASVDNAVGGRAALLGLALAVFAVAFLLCRRREGSRRVALVAMAGFLGMILETTLILTYQTSRGVLYQDIGLLFTVFMGGLAVGAFSVGRLAVPGKASGSMARSTGPGPAARIGAPGSIARMTTPRPLARITGSGLSARNAGLGSLIAFAVLGLAVARLLEREQLDDLATTSALLFLTGFLVAAVFAFATLHRVSDQKRVVSPLYAADLLGGCVGSVLGSLLLIPGLGLPGTAMLSSGLAGVSLILVL
jgi:spermidine synthase